MKKTLIMWAEPDWYKEKKKDLKSGFDKWSWGNSINPFYQSPFDPVLHEPITDVKSRDVIKVRVTIEEIK